MGAMHHPLWDIDRPAHEIFNPASMHNVFLPQITRVGNISVWLQNMILWGQRRKYVQNLMQL